MPSENFSAFFVIVWAGGRAVTFDKRQLRFYEKLPVDLVAYYRSKALNVVHIDAPIMRKPPLSDQHLKEVWEAYQKLQVDGCHA
jgi:hypothetical protein